MRRIVIPILVLFVLAAVLIGHPFHKDNGAPVISYMGMSTGSLVTDMAKLSFRNTFSVNDRSLIGLIAYKSLPNNTTVQATWFSPNDLTPPIGRTTQVTQSGANVVRFSIQNTRQWTPAPYMMQVATFDANQKETSSGSIQFYIGMTPQQINEYEKAYAAQLQQVELQKQRAADQAKRAAIRGANQSSAAAQ